MKNITYKVKKVNYTKGDFHIIKADTKELGVITIQGDMKYVSEGDIFTADLKKELHKVYGYFYKLSSVPKKEKLAVDLTAMKQLQKSVTGIGKKTIEKIFEQYGSDTLDVIASTPEKLKELKIPQAKISTLHNAVLASRNFQELLAFFQLNNIDTELAYIIDREFTGMNVSRIRANPFELIVSPSIQFEKLDAIHKQFNGNPEAPERVRAIIIDMMRKNSASLGNMYTKKLELVEDIMNRFNVVTKATILNEAKTLVEQKELIEEDGDLYLPAMYQAEEGIVRRIQDFQESFLLPFTQKALIDAEIKREERTGVTLATKQREAISMILLNRMSVLTGGPGTGKTSTLKMTVGVMKALKPSVRIKLMAPTGKAAKRMSEATGMPSMTIHRALGIKGFGDTQADEKLEYDFVIVDESSMIDASLFLKLLKSLGDETRLVLVGDSNQLDSVGAGRILKDIIESNFVAVTELDEVFRQASTSQIVSNAHAMIAGKDFSNGLTADVKKGDFYFIQRNDEEEIQRDTLETVRRFVKKGMKLEEIMILAPMRKGVIGVEMLNKLIQKEFNPPAMSMDFEKKTTGQVLRVGDRVMHTENNKELGVFNGEMGTIVGIYTGVRNGQEHTVVEVEYIDREEVVEYVGATIEELELAYAITIHKSQGSEAPLVIMPTHRTQKHMLSRSLIYTGITRAKNTVILIGEQEAINDGLKVVSSDKRLSNISNKLKA